MRKHLLLTLKWYYAAIDLPGSGFDRRARRQLKFWSEGLIYVSIKHHLSFNLTQTSQVLLSASNRFLKSREEITASFHKTCWDWHVPEVFFAHSREWMTESTHCAVCGSRIHYCYYRYIEDKCHSLRWQCSNNEVNEAAMKSSLRLGFDIWIHWHQSLIEPKTECN